MSLETAYISSSCNHTPSVAHWGKNNLVCYGSCNAVLIYDPNFGSGKIIINLIKHTKRVNSVRWISGITHETEIISGSADGTAIIWRQVDKQFVPFVLKGHGSNVNVVDGLYRNAETKSAVVVTASVDSTVRIWTRLQENEDFIQTQCINFGHGICICIKLTFLNCETLLMACAIDNSHIELYINDSEEVNFSKSEVLKGHEDWVRGLDFTRDENNDLLLASSSQDSLIQLFKISAVDNIEKEKYFIKTAKNNYKINLESILTGHEGWIYSVDWNPLSLKLLSASIDKSLLIWEYDTLAKLWLETTRLGEVGGNTLGFYGAMFGPDGSTILAHSYHGAFHIWNYDNETNTWTPVVTVGGHFDEVVDISWEPKGEFLISLSSDQTTRIHAPWKRNETDVITWHEIARPQVHGYDLSCLAILSRYRFVSGADEKVIRAFDAPENFIENFRRICHIQDDELNGSDFAPKGASVPSLGLSNKAVYENDNNEQARPKSNKDPYPEESHFTAVELYEPPTEETLIQNTLWPEVQKLYGHGYEIYSLAASHDGKILASACKSTTTEHAAILLWDTSTWQQVQKLVSHSLTVAQLAFSPDSNHLLSVSRDRRWSLFTKYSDTLRYELVATTDKKNGIHTRIIWCCAWTHDSKYFVTGSRDGKVVVWTKNEDKTVDSVLGQYESASEHLELKGESVTALACAPDLIKDQYMIAVGLERGFIYLFKWFMKWTNILVLHNSSAHHLTVKKLVFRPKFGEAGVSVPNTNILQLSSCSSDHFVKIYNIDTSTV